MVEVSMYYVKESDSSCILNKKKNVVQLFSDLDKIFSEHDLGDYPKVDEYVQIRFVPDIKSGIDPIEKRVRNYDAEIFQELKNFMYK